MKRILASIIVGLSLLASACAPAAAQSACQYIVFGAVLTAAQWNACFSAKSDTVPGGYLPLSGGTMSGGIITVASATGKAGFNLPPGTAPSSPNNGDIWTTSAGLFAQINGTTIGPFVSSASAASLTVNGTTINSGTSGYIEYNNGGTLSEKAVTGTGSVVLASSPTISSPTLSSPTISGTLTGAGVVAFANIANLGASSLFGNPTGSPATMEAITLGTSLNFSSTVLNCTTATSAVIGCARPDNSTITISAGVLTVVGGVATAVTVGTTTVGSGSSGSLLYDNGGTLGNETIASILTAGTGIGITGTTNATITNSGVTSAVAGSGISVSAATGAVTFTNTGVINLTIAGYGGITTAGTCGGITGTATCDIATPGGSLNRFRNGSFVIDSRGGSNITLGTSGGYSVDGWKLYFTGSTTVLWSLNVGGHGGGGNATWNYLGIEGGSGNTDIAIEQRIEGQQAFPIAGVQVTAQILFFNNTGASVALKISSCSASAFDNFGTCTPDLAATALTACPNNDICLEAYSWLTNQNAENGYAVKFDCAGGATGSNYCAFAQADIRATPGAPTGIPTIVAPPEMHSFGEEVADNGIWFSSTYNNGVAPGTATAVGLKGGAVGSTPAPFTFQYPVKMFCAAPTISYWDAAGNASKYSTYASNTLTNNVGALTIENSSQTGFQGYQASQINEFIHYTANCEL